MGILRVPVLLTFAVFLAGCAQHIPVLETQDDVSTTTAQPDRTTTAKVISETKKPKPPAPKPAATASTTPRENTITSTVPKDVGSPQKWEKEHAEEERKEQHLKQVIEGICRGC